MAKEKADETTNDKPVIITEETIDKIITVLKEGEIKKKDLALKVGIDSKKITESVMHRVLIKARDFATYDNLIKSKKGSGGKNKMNPKYSVSSGIIITKAHLADKNIKPDQRYQIAFLDKGVIKLTPNVIDPE